MSLNPSYNIGMLCTKLCWTLSITWAMFIIRHFGNFLLGLELLVVVILTERIKILYIVHLVLILMRVIT
jgi:hypothetical protein